MYKSLNDVELVIALSKPVEVIDMFVESYLQGIEYDKWCEDKDLDEVIESTVTDEEGNETIVTTLVNVYEPIEVDVFGWKMANYKLLRKYNYPPMEDYLDAIVKSDIEAQEAYINKCLEIKARFPKE